VSGFGAFAALASRVCSREPFRGAMGSAYRRARQGLGIAIGAILVSCGARPNHESVELQTPDSETTSMDAMASEAARSQRAAPSSPPGEPAQQIAMVAGPVECAPCRY
jgi:hypothetical protein